MEWIRQETIGHGSFSTVSLATTSSLEFPPLIAVKSTGIVSSATLQHERNIFHNLGECSEIVTCYGEKRTVENGEEIYNLLLEYASNGNLSDRVKNKNSGLGIPEFEIRRFTKSIVKGLVHIHERGYSHCDLKLENVLVFGDGDYVKIGDFGLAKRFSEISNRTGEIRGTPLYMAPESVKCGEFEAPVDIWGLGCCVVEMCSGETAWCLDGESGNVMSLLVKIGLSDEVPVIPVGLSADGRDFVEKCFVKNPVERWTAKMLLEHPFLVDDGSVSVLVSPRNPFDFPGWSSVQSPVKGDLKIKSQPKGQNRFGCGLVRSVEERISGLVSEKGPDWSVMCDWVNVR